MANNASTELRNFHNFLGDKLTGEGAALSPEEVLDEWRSMNPFRQDLDEDASAIKEALEDLAKGDRGISFDEFDREFRKRQNLSA